MNYPKQKLRRLAFSKITVLSMAALLIAALGVSVANDLYAFVKPDQEISLAIDQATSPGEISKRLEEHGVISNPTVFRLYVKSTGQDKLLEEFHGTLTLNSNMSYRQILMSFSKSQ